MTKVVLIRHGHVEGIEPPRFRGREDVPLTEQGKAEARAVAAAVAKRWHPTIAYTSHLQRCVSTAEAIAAATNCPQETLASLTDLDYGAFQWKTYTEAREAWPDLYQAWFKAPERVHFPEGESLKDLVSRTADALTTIIRLHPDETLVMVGHDNVNRAFLLQLLDQPLSAFWRLSQSPCCINTFEVIGSHTRVHSINETSHLDDLHNTPWRVGNPTDQRS